MFDDITLKDIIKLETYINRVQLMQTSRGFWDFASYFFSNYLKAFLYGIWSVSLTQTLSLRKIIQNNINLL
jgi:hypothetical protein